jgi:hypothetical protein
MTGYNTKCASIEDARKDDEEIAVEQFLSGICSDKCWDECSEAELYTYKFVKPYSFGKTQKVINISSTGKVYEVDCAKYENSWEAEQVRRFCETEDQ